MPELRKENKNGNLHVCQYFCDQGVGIFTAYLLFSAVYFFGAVFKIAQLKISCEHLSKTDSSLWVVSRDTIRYACEGRGPQI